MQTEPITQHSKYGDLDVTTITAAHDSVSTIIHRGVTITWSYDSRGEGHDKFYEFITLERNGHELDFNTLDDARDFIDDVLDSADNAGFNAMDEWGLTLRDVV